MFSGIVEGLENAVKIKKNDQSMEVTLPVPKNWSIKTGDSVSIDGICSTVKEAKDKTFSVYYMPETIRKTNLSKVSETHQFNLERSLRLNSFLGGHLVSGHIDATAKVLKITTEQDALIVIFTIDSSCARYIIYKGSIAVNGVSLTIVDVDKDSFMVSLIPYTQTHTNLGFLKVGDVVNIEVDLIAKYVEKMLSNRKLDRKS